VPGGISASRIRTPSISVPLVLPQSRITMVLPRTETSQWNRDTVRSASTRSLPSAVPIRAISLPTCARAPRDGPSTTASATDQIRIVWAGATREVTSCSASLGRSDLPGPCWASRSTDPVYHRA
jgi:hypothetical protein